MSPRAWRSVAAILVFIGGVVYVATVEMSTGATLAVLVIVTIILLDLTLPHRQERK